MNIKSVIFNIIILILFITLIVQVYFFIESPNKNKSTSDKKVSNVLKKEEQGDEITDVSIFKLLDEITPSYDGNFYLYKNGTLNKENLMSYDSTNENPNRMLFEKVLKVKYYKTKLEIITAVVYKIYNTDTNNEQNTSFYKDYSLRVKLEKLSNEINHDNINENNIIDTYIDENKNNLEQYTYTFNKDKKNNYSFYKAERSHD